MLEIIYQDFNNNGFSLRMEKRKSVFGSCGFLSNALCRMFYVHFKIAVNCVLHRHVGKAVFCVAARRKLHIYEMSHSVKVARKNSCSNNIDQHLK